MNIVKGLNVKIRNGYRPEHTGNESYLVRFGAAICDELENRGLKNLVKENTGLPLSPYFSAAKLAWIMRNVPEATKLAGENNLCMGTVDSWLIHKMTGGKIFKTDYSNASMTPFLSAGLEILSRCATSLKHSATFAFCKLVRARSISGRLCAMKANSSKNSTCNFRQFHFPNLLRKLGSLKRKAPKLKRRLIISTKTWKFA